MTTRFNFRAVVLGALLDIVGSVVAFAILRAVLGSRWRGGHPPMVLEDAVGLAFSFFAGGVAGRLARSRELVNSVATAVPCFVLGLAVPTDMTSSPIWHVVLSHAGMFPFALLGGYCARKWNRAGVV